MNNFLKSLAKPFHRWTQKRRDAYYKKMRTTLQNTTPTIIASDCFGGLVYHNLGLQFRSPTVNLFIEKEDFFHFVQNLKEYLQNDVTDITTDNDAYPMGQIIYNNTPIRIHFMHYNTFEQAKEKWEQRKQRIDWNNLYIILTIESKPTQEDISRFNSLPYQNKLLIVNDDNPAYPNAVTCSVFKKRDYRHGKILDYTSRFSVKRYMDEIDYVSFLNQPNK